MSLCQCVVDVGTDGVKRGTTLLEHLAAGHFGAADATADLNLDAFCAHTHRGCDGHLDGTAIRNAALELTCDVVGDDVGVNFRALHLEDVDLDVFTADLLQFLFDLVDLLAALADDDTGTGRVDGHRDDLEGALNHDLRQRSLCQTCVEVFADLGVFQNPGGVVTVPVGVPTADNTYTIADRIGFLSHIT